MPLRVTTHGVCVELAVVDSNGDTHDSLSFAPYAVADDFPVLTVRALRAGVRLDIPTGVFVMRLDGLVFTCIMDGIGALTWRLGCDTECAALVAALNAAVKHATAFDT